MALILFLRWDLVNMEGATVTANCVDLYSGGEA